MEDLRFPVEDTGNRAEEEPVWLTPHLRDSQPEGEREREIL